MKKYHFILIHLQILPDSISKLKHLKLFNIDQNKVMEIGDFIGGFKSLLSLEGTNNNCSRLSTKIGSLSSLNRLSLPMNRLEVRNVPNSKYSLYQ
jgi:Leucine-rich repeat (LRR) protein